MDKLVIGADPEIIFLNRDGDIIPANEIAHDRNSGFGHDGHPSTGEIRPGYSSNILEIIGKIENILLQAEHKLDLSSKISAIQCGHYKKNKALGGHIHLATPGHKVHRDYDKMAPYLDLLLEDCVEDLLAPNDERTTRISKGYGRKYRDHQEAIRVKEEERVEYRAPGSWLISPEVAYTYLYVAKITALLSYKNPDLMREVTEATRPKTLLRKRRLLKDVVTASRSIVKDDDTELGRDILTDVIAPTYDIDWDEDIRKNWIV